MGLDRFVKSDLAAPGRVQSLTSLLEEVHESCQLQRQRELEVRPYGTFLVLMDSPNTDEKAETDDRLDNLQKR